MMTAEGALLDALFTADMFPETFWEHGDDACDCTFQRVGMWTNPYLGKTLEVRMCCIWEELYKLFPQHVRTSSGFLDYNRNEWVPGQREWDGTTEMPRALWYRQIAERTGTPLPEVRTSYAALTPPQGVPEPEVPESEPDMLAALFQIVLDMAGRMDALEAK